MIININRPGLGLHLCGNLPLRRLANNSNYTTRAQHNVNNWKNSEHYNKTISIYTIVRGELVQVKLQVKRSGGFLVRDDRRGSVLDCLVSSGEVVELLGKYSSAQSLHEVG